MLKKLLFILVLLTISVQAQGLSGVVICIDPGHGGHDPANDRFIEATGFWESDGNWAKANFIKPILEDMGATVVLTRDGNDDSDDLPLSQRAAIANSYNVDYFNSIHSNGWQGTDNYTLVLFRGTDNSPVFPMAKAMAQKLAPSIKSHNRTTSYSVRGDWSFYPTWDPPGLGVLRPLNMPGTLTEGSFHDYIPESWRLKGAAYQKHEAYAIARAMLSYFNGSTGTGSIAGILRDPERDVQYYYQSASNDKNVPLNYPKAWVEGSEDVFTGDDQNNGFFLLDSLAPGEYKVYMEAENYAVDSATVTVSEDQTVFVDKWLEEAPNYNPPMIVSVTPENNAEEVSLASNISIKFDIPMNTDITENAISVAPAFDYTANWSENNKRVTLVPDELLSSNQEYLVNISTDAKTKYDANLEEAFFSMFTTRTKLHLVSNYPYNNELDVSSTVEITLNFDAPILESSMGGNVGFYNEDGDAVSVQVKRQYLLDGKLIFYPTNELQPYSLYRVALRAGISDREGLTLGEDIDIYFTTGPIISVQGDVVMNFEDVDGWWDPEQSGSTSGTQPDSTYFEASEDMVLNGSKAGKLAYNFTDISGICRVFNSNKPSVGNVNDDHFGIWVYGDLSGNYLEYWFYQNQSTNVIARVDTLDWSGWKFISVKKSDLEASGDLLFHSIVVRQASESNHIGVIYFDDGSVGSITGVDETQTQMPEKFALDQNYPNPFNPVTTISFNLPEAMDVSLEIFNILGQKVTTLVSAQMQSGHHSVKWNASNLPSGIYVYYLNAGKYSESKKMMLLK